MIPLLGSEVLLYVVPLVILAFVIVTLCASCSKKRSNMESTVGCDSVQVTLHQVAGLNHSTGPIYSLPNLNHLNHHGGSPPAIPRHQNQPVPAPPQHHTYNPTSNVPPLPPPHAVSATMHHSQVPPVVPPHANHHHHLGHSMSREEPIPPPPPPHSSQQQQLQQQMCNNNNSQGPSSGLEAVIGPPGSSSSSAASSAVGSHATSPGSTSNSSSQEVNEEGTVAVTEISYNKISVREPLSRVLAERAVLEHTYTEVEEEERLSSFYEEIAGSTNSSVTYTKIGDLIPSLHPSGSASSASGLHHHQPSSSQQQLGPSTSSTSGINMMHPRTATVTVNGKIFSIPPPSAGSNGLTIQSTSSHQLPPPPASMLMPESPHSTRSRDMSTPPPPPSVESLLSVAKTSNSRAASPSPLPPPPPPPPLHPGLISNDSYEDEDDSLYAFIDKSSKIKKQDSITSNVSNDVYAVIDKPPMDPAKIFLKVGALAAAATNGHSQPPPPPPPPMMHHHSELPPPPPLPPAFGSSPVPNPQSSSWSRYGIKGDDSPINKMNGKGSLNRIRADSEDSSLMDDPGYEMIIKAKTSSDAVDSSGGSNVRSRIPINDDHYDDFDEPGYEEIGRQFHRPPVLNGSHHKTMDTSPTTSQPPVQRHSNPLPPITSQHHVYERCVSNTRSSTLNSVSDKKGHPHHNGTNGNHHIPTSHSSHHYTGLVSNQTPPPPPPPPQPIYNQIGHNHSRHVPPASTSSLLPLPLTKMTQGSPSKGSITSPGVPPPIPPPPIYSDGSIADPGYEVVGGRRMSTGGNESEMENEEPGYEVISKRSSGSSIHSSAHLPSIASGSHHLHNNHPLTVNHQRLSSSTSLPREDAYMQEPGYEVIKRTPQPLPPAPIPPPHKIKGPAPQIPPNSSLYSGVQRQESVASTADPGYERVRFVRRGLSLDTDEEESVAEPTYARLKKYEEGFSERL